MVPYGLKLAEVIRICEQSGNMHLGAVVRAHIDGLYLGDTLISSFGGSLYNYSFLVEQAAKDASRYLECDSVVSRIGRTHVREYNTCLSPVPKEQDRDGDYNGKIVWEVIRSELTSSQPVVIGRIEVNVYSFYYK